MTSPVEWLIILPFAGACIAFLARGPVSHVAHGIAVSANAAAAVWLGATVWQDGPQRYDLGGWPAPLGIGLYADGLGAVLVLTTAAIAVAVGLYSFAYFPRGEDGESWTGRRAFTPLWLFLLASLNALFLSADIFNLYVVLELLTLAGVGLVILARDRVALIAGMRYLLAAFFGSLIYLFGVALLYGAYDTLDIGLLAERVTSGGVLWTAAALMLLGVAIKAALFPFHAWLPEAHAGAPAPVSALLSALVVKAGFYVAVRLWTMLFMDDVGVAAAQVLGALGAAGIIWGSLQALRMERLKLVIAYSTVGQLGYLFLLFPMVTVSNPGAPEPWALGAWSGGIYYAVSHAFAKAAIFLCAGTVMHRTGSDDLTKLRGLTTTLPLTAFAMGIAGIALIGLPPSGIFVAKWLLITASIESGQWWWAVIILFGTLLTAAYIFKLIRLLFTHQREQHDGQGRSPRVMEMTAMALALVVLALGLRSLEPLSLIESGSPLLLPLEAGG